MRINYSYKVKHEYKNVEINYKCIFHRRDNDMKQGYIRCEF